MWRARGDPSHHIDDGGDGAADPDGGALRGKYRCGRCGQYKVNHDCPYETDQQVRTVGAQVGSTSLDPLVRKCVRKCVLGRTQEKKY